MTELEKLLAIEEIRQLRPRYFRLVDAKAFDELPDLFTEDAWFDSHEAVWDPVRGQYPGFPMAPVSKGRDAVMAGLRAGLPPALQSCHMGHTGEIELTGEDTARGIIPFSDRLLLPGVLATAGYGYYYDDYARADGKWRIKGSTLRRKRVLFEDELGNGVDLSGQ